MVLRLRPVHGKSSDFPFFLLAAVTWARDRRPTGLNRSARPQGRPQVSLCPSRRKDGSGGIQGVSPEQTRGFPDLRSHQPARPASRRAARAARAGRFADLSAGAEHRRGRAGWLPVLGRRARRTGRHRWRTAPVGRGPLAAARASCITGYARVRSIVGDSRTTRTAILSRTVRSTGCPVHARGLRTYPPRTTSGPTPMGGRSRQPWLISDTGHARNDARAGSGVGRHPSRGRGANGIRAARSTGGTGSRLDRRSSRAAGRARADGRPRPCHLRFASDPSRTGAGGPGPRAGHRDRPRAHSRARSRLPRERLHGGAGPARRCHARRRAVRHTGGNPCVSAARSAHCRTATSACGPARGNGGAR